MMKKIFLLLFLLLFIIPTTFALSLQKDWNVISKQSIKNIQSIIDLKTEKKNRRDMDDE